jgi:hypothetical protein
MANYKETAVTATQWRRAIAINIRNVYQSVPRMAIEEEDVLAMPDGRLIFTPAGSLVSLFDPSRTIPLRDPATGELTGEEVSEAFLQQLLYSLYMREALERDNPPAPAEPPAE